jgi:hypothetical protein
MGKISFSIVNYILSLTRLTTFHSFDALLIALF